MQDRFSSPDGRMGISRLIVLVRLLHLLLPTAPLCAVILVLLRGHPVAFAIAAVLWGMWFIILPIYLIIWRNGYGYQIKDGVLQIESGVLFRRDRRMPLASIQYISMFATPLERLLGLSDVVVHAAGGFLWIAGLSNEHAQTLYHTLEEIVTGGDHGRDL